MDETKTPQQDNPVVETPSGDKGTTPEKTPETLEEQVKHIKETAFAEVGRHRVATEKAVKEAETAKRSADAAEVRLNKFIKEQEEAELEVARDDSDALTRIRAKQRERERESELAKVKQELSEKEERIKLLDETEAESTKERNAREVAARFEVDSERLSKLAKFTDGSSTAIEDIAKELPKKGEIKEPLTPDSGKTIGGGEDLSGLSPLERSGRELKLARQMQKARRTGEGDKDYKL